MNRLTAEEIEVRVWAFVIVILVTILLGAMAMFLYSVTYVTQPMSGMAPSTRFTPSRSAPSWCLSLACWAALSGRSALRQSPTPWPKQKRTTMSLLNPSVLLGITLAVIEQFSSCYQRQASRSTTASNWRSPRSTPRREPKSRRWPSPSTPPQMN